MEHLKFNCYELAELNGEFVSIKKKLTSYEERLAGIIRELEPEISSYAKIQEQLETEKKAIQKLALSVSKQYKDLDEIIDIYYHAENEVLSTINNLPVNSSSDSRKKKVTQTLPNELTISSINNHSLIVEGWLAELVAKHINNDGK